MTHRLRANDKAVVLGAFYASFPRWASTSGRAANGRAWSFLFRSQSVLAPEELCSSNGSAPPAQHLILCDFADALGLLIPHLDDGDLVTVGDADRNLLASGLYLF